MDPGKSEMENLCDYEKRVEFTNEPKMAISSSQFCDLIVEVEVGDDVEGEGGGSTDLTDSCKVVFITSSIYDDKEIPYFGMPLTFLIGMALLINKA